MNAGVKIAAFAVGLLAIAGLGAVIGDTAGPIEVDDAEHTEQHAATEAPAGHDEHEDGSAGERPGGLLVAEDGYRFVAERTTLDPATEQAFAFRIIGPDDAAVESYDVLHDKELHLVVVSRDLQQYAHVHPTRDPSGRWSVTLPSLPAGSYRAVADFQPTGHEQLTLGHDLTIAGSSQPLEDDPDSALATLDGYEITLDGDPAEGEVQLTVRRDGAVVTTEPYLGAAGHLVAIRDGDLAYLHVHPIDEVPAGPVRFGIEVPSEGRYALFFDFAHDGVVRTARFVVTVGEPAAPEHSHDGGGH